MRYALILAGRWGSCWPRGRRRCSAPSTSPSYGAGRGRAADPGGRAVLPGAAVGRLLDPERGRADAARRCSLMAVTLAIGAAGVALCGAARRARDADAGRRRDARPRSPPATGLSRRWSCCATRLGRHAAGRHGRARRRSRWRPAVVAARLVPGHGKIVGLAVMALAGDRLRRGPDRHARVRPRGSRQVRQGLYVAALTARAAYRGAAPWHSGRMVKGVASSRGGTGARLYARGRDRRPRSRSSSFRAPSGSRWSRASPPCCPADSVGEVSAGGLDRRVAGAAR